MNGICLVTDTVFYASSSVPYTSALSGLCWLQWFNSFWAFPSVSCTQLHCPTPVQCRYLHRHTSIRTESHSSYWIFRNWSCRCLFLIYNIHTFSHAIRQSHEPYPPISTLSDPTSTAHNICRRFLHIEEGFVRVMLPRIIVTILNTYDTWILLETSSFVSYVSALSESGHRYLRMSSKVNWCPWMKWPLCMLLLRKDCMNCTFYLHYRHECIHHGFCLKPCH